MSAHLIVPPEIRANIQAESCATCRYSHTDETGDLVCRKSPPQATVLMVPAPPPRVGVVPLPFCTFPMIKPDQWCGAWEARSDR